MVDLTNAILRLHAVDLRGIVHVITEEVDRLTSGVDLCLVDILTLSEHTGSIHDRAILRCQQLSHLQDDSRTGGPWCTTPLLMSLHGSLDSHLHLFLTHLMIGSQHMFVVVRTGYLAHITGAYLFSTDNDRDIHHEFTLSFEFFLQCHALWRVFQISLYRFIGRQWECNH